MTHDLENGQIVRCQICLSPDLKLVLDLGFHAPCDSLLTNEQLKEPEKTYPLRLVYCENCSLIQIDYIVPPEVLFYKEYPYRSGITETLKKNLIGISDKLVDRLKLKPSDLVIDIGSNDGTILEGFKSRGIRVLGVEPTNIADIAIQNGIDTINEFFSEEVAKQILYNYGKASLIVGANVFAHVARLGSLLRGVNLLLEENGIFLNESHYLMDILNKVQYDSIYHEHLRFYSLKSMKMLMQYNNFNIYDVENITNYGGSIRCYAQKGTSRFETDELKSLETLEMTKNINDLQSLELFKKRTEQSKFDLMTLLYNLKNDQKTIVGIGCPGRASTLLNYCGIDTSLLPYIAEQSTCLKIGLFLPGSHIPIIDEEIMFQAQPDYVLLLSWHYFEPIIRKLREKGLRSKIILPLPEVKVIEQ